MSLADAHLRDALIARLTGTLSMNQFSREIRDSLCGLPCPWDYCGWPFTGGRRPEPRTGLPGGPLRYVPDTAAAPVLTVFASFTWWRGNGALSRVVLDRALRCEPDYRLALLLDRKVELGIRPT